MSLSPSGEPSVFLSYASGDRAQALAVADALEGSGVRVWLDRRAIVGGTSWDAATVRGITDCFAFLLLCTDAAMRSPNVTQEVRLALEERRPIIPLLVQPVTFPDELRYALVGRQWIELLERPTAAWLTDLRAAL